MVRFHRSTNQEYSELLLCVIPAYKLLPEGSLNRPRELIASFYNIVPDPGLFSKWPALPASSCRRSHVSVCLVSKKNVFVPMVGDKT